MRLPLITASLIALAAAPAGAAITFGGLLTVAGGETDLSGQPTTFGSNRLSFGSDLTYDAGTGLFYGITDRGPGGGFLPFTPRLNTFSLSLNPTTGAPTAFNLVSTTLFRRPDGTGFNGLNPTLLNGASGVLGNSFDPEGVARLANGNFLVSDEYGPSVYEFTAGGTFVRAFTPPANLLPREADADLNFVDGRPTIATGRQDNRGYEGLTVSVDGTKAYAILQDPLVNEGEQTDGRRSRNLRIVEYDIATGTSTAQYIYELEGIATINDRVPGTANDFAATAQGRNIGVSSITALADGSFLIIERDNRGVGVDDPTGANPVGTKRVYRIRLDGATNVAGLSLANTNNLPGGVVPVSKQLYLDIQAALGFDALEKLEGLAFGPMLAGGALSLIIVSDNDFSVTQNGSNTQFDVCTPGDTNAASTRIEVALGTPCPTGTNLVPSGIYGFRVTGADIPIAVPEPATWALMIAGFGLVGAAARRRRPIVVA